MALLSLYRRLRPDIVHHLTIKPNLYGGIAARLMGLPGVVYAITGLGQTVLIQGSGVDLDLFKPAVQTEGEPVVIVPSRLIWEKGIQEFVDAVRQLRVEGVAARFALAGNAYPSNPRAVPEETLRGWAEDGDVEWWGRREDMPEVMAESHIACLLSKYGEGVPKVFLEAAAAGRPVVATDTSGCRKVIEHGAEGLLVPAGDSAALAAALRRLVEKPDQRHAMGGWRGRRQSKLKCKQNRLAHPGDLWGATGALRRRLI
jgi:glycosyltransferase involved in cell wall biosynthesis